MNVKKAQLLTLSNKEALVSKLIKAGYAFAVWRMPHDASYHFIISLSAPSTVDQPIHTLDKGFIINKYSANHPVAPFFLRGDLCLTENETHIDPCVNDQQLASLFHHLSQSEPAEKNQPVKHSQPNPTSDYKAKVAAAVSAIREGQFDKVVLSRYQDIPLPEGFSPWQFFQKSCGAYPNAFCSLTHLPREGLWLGASPELLVADDGQTFKTIALAGTKPLGVDAALKEIAWTHKEIEEQAMVSRYIINCFKKLRLREFKEHGPKTVKSGQLAHLKTVYEVNYGDLAFEGLADQMLTLLHPTSAVCGMPMKQARDWIEKVEAYNRSFYAGFLGPVNFHNQTHLFVNLRCMRILKNSIRLYAGAGITEDSVPQKEFEETQLKMEVMKRLL